MDRKVDFFIVGAAKSGTTSVYRYLSTHPDLFLPADKEPHFFGDQRPPGKYGKYPSFDHYMALFEGARSDQLVGEGSPGYLYSTTAAREIHRHNPAAKIIILLRDPRDRAYSLFLHHLRDYVEARDMQFEQALALEHDRMAKKDHFGLHYLHGGLYADQVERYLREFGAPQVQIKLMEDLVADSVATMNSLCDFLEVPRSPLSIEAVHNKSGEHTNRLVAYWLARPNLLRSMAKKVLPHRAGALRERIVQRNLALPKPMNPETRARLTDFFRQDVERLQQLIGRDLSHWIA